MILELNFQPVIAPPPPDPYPSIVSGWRGLHVAEGGRIPNPLGSPGILPPYNPTIKLEMTRDIQLMSYDLMSAFHPAVAESRDKWKRVHGWATAMNNGTGYDNPDDLRRDYVTQFPSVVDATSPNPYYDKMQRSFQGSFITGTLNGYSAWSAVLNVLHTIRIRQFKQSFRAMRAINSLTPNLIWCEPGQDAIDARGFVYEPGTLEAQETLKKIIDHHWFVVGVAEYASYAVRFKGHWLPEGWIVYPFILDRAVSFEARFFRRWESEHYPHPTTIYNPL